MDRQRRLRMDREPQRGEIEMVEVRRRGGSSGLCVGVEARVLGGERQSRRAEHEDDATRHSARDEKDEGGEDDEPVACAPSAPADPLELSCFDVGWDGGTPWGLGCRDSISSSTPRGEVRPQFPPRHAGRSGRISSPPCGEVRP